MGIKLRPERRVFVDSANVEKEADAEEMKKVAADPIESGKTRGVKLNPVVDSGKVDCEEKKNRCVNASVTKSNLKSKTTTKSKRPKSRRRTRVKTRSRRKINDAAPAKIKNVIKKTRKNGVASRKKKRN